MSCFGYVLPQPTPHPLCPTPVKQKLKIHTRLLNFVSEKRIKQRINSYGQKVSSDHKLSSKKVWIKENVNLQFDNTLKWSLKLWSTKEQLKENVQLDKNISRISKTITNCNLNRYEQEYLKWSLTVNETGMNKNISNDH